MNFQVNLTTLQTLIDVILNDLNNTKHSNITDGKEGYVKDIERIEKNLIIKQQELNDITYGSQLKSNRVKRFAFLGIMTNDDGQKIQMDFETFKKHVNNLTAEHNELKIKYTHSVSLHNQTLMEILRQNFLRDAKNELMHIDAIIGSIITMQTLQRLSTIFVSYAEFEQQLNVIKESLNDEYDELPYERISEYFYNLKVEHEIDGNIIKLRVDVPIVEKYSRKLYEILQFPALYQDTLITTNIESKYIAMGDEDAVMLNNLDDSCVGVQMLYSTYYCNTVSPAIKLNQSDCVVNALTNEEIDPTICHLSSAKFLQLVFIRLTEGTYFFYSPADESLTVTCNGTSSLEVLRKKSIGMLYMEPGCRAETKKFKIYTMRRSDQTVNEKLLDVGFDLEKLQERMKDTESPIYKDELYLEGMKHLRKMSKESKPVQTMRNFMYQAGLTPKEVFIAVGCVGIMIFFVVYTLKFRQNHSKKV